MKPASWPRGEPLSERLLWLDPATGAMDDRAVRELPQLLTRGDLLIVNDAATLPASFRVTTPGGPAELRLAGRTATGTFRAVLLGAGDWHQLTTERPAPPPVAAGDALSLNGVAARVTTVSPLSPRLIEIAFALPETDLYPALYRAGAPVQYWYQEDRLADWHVQTPYAARPWAVEMPSAGRPLTLPLLVALKRRGVALASLTHAAGLSATGDEALDRALPLPELTEIPAATVQAVARAKAAGGRVVAIGTSVVRALEGTVHRHGALIAWRGEVTLRIGPGFVPRVVDALFTGMHDSGESHFDLLGAFAAPDQLARATAHAEAAGYLCHEFGDSTLIARRPAA